MKKNIYSLLILSTITILIINIFIKSQNLNQIIIFSINLFIKNIFPSLFPMFIISNILIEIDIPNFLGNISGNIFKKLFKTTPHASFIFFMSIITGFPSSAKYINDLLNKQLITSKEAEKILTFTFFSNPLFIINTVGNTFFKNKKIGIILLITHFISNIIIGIIFRNTNISKIENNNKEKNNYKKLIDKINNTNIFTVILDSIKSSLEIMINIFGIVTFFLIIINITIKNPSNIFSILTSGIIEMTTGLKYLSISNLSIPTKAIISSFFISFGGLSIHSQIMNILKEKKVKYLPFLKVRILHGIINATIIYIIYLFIF